MRLIMRWKKKKPKPFPKDGDKRVVKKFLWKPRCFNDEYRWLEFAEINEIYHVIKINLGMYAHGYWEEVGYNEVNYENIF